jgi:hypothetical protein
MTSLGEDEMIIGIRFPVPQLRRVCPTPRRLRPSHGRRGGDRGDRADRAGRGRVSSRPGRRR